LEFERNKILTLDTLDISDIIHDPEKSQFKMRIGKFLAIIDYKIRKDKMYLIHSEVPYHLQGKGFGKLLVEKSFAYIEKHNIKAVAVCSYIELIKRRNEKWNKIIG